MIERNSNNKLRNASIEEDLPAWAAILMNRELTAEDREVILLGCDSGFDAGRKKILKVA